MSHDPHQAHQPAHQSTLASRAVSIGGNVGGHVVTGDGNTVNNVTHQYTRSDAEEKARLQQEAAALFAQLPTDSLPPHQTLPDPSRPVYGRNPDFVGRERELRQLAQQLKAGQHVAVVATGMGGMGKSQLAIEFAHRYGHYFAGGVYWVSLAQKESVPNELADCAVRLGLGELGQMPVPELISRVQQAWETPLPRLLIFDNCEDEGLYEQYRPKTGASRILLTSRRGEWQMGGVALLPLRQLPRPDSIALLQTVCARLSEAEADEIAAELGDFPLALHLAGGYLRRYRGVTVGQLLAELQSAALRHEALKHHKGVGPNPSGHDWDVARTFELSFAKLRAEEGDELALQLLARAACFAPGEPMPEALLWQTVAGSGDADAVDDRLLMEAQYRLLELGLLAQGEGDEGWVQLHRLLVQFVQERLEVEREGALTAVEQTLQREASKLNQAGYPLTLRPWVVHLQFVTDTAVVRQAEKAANLCNELGYHIGATGDYAGARPYYKEALQIKRKVLGDLHPDTALSLNNMGYILRVMGELAGARSYYEEALQIRRTVLGNQHPDTAQSLNNMGYLLRGMGDLGEAWPYYEEALQIFRTLLGNEHPDTAGSLNNMGALLRAMGDLAGARPYYEEALQIRRRVLGNLHPDTAISLNNMGALLHSMGYTVGARPYYEQALQIRRKVLGDQHPDTAQSLNNMGGLLQAMGDLTGARPYYEEALQIFRMVFGDQHPSTAQSLNNLAVLFAYENDFATAHTLMSQAVAIWEAALGANHPDTQDSRQNLAAIAAKLP